MKKILFVCTGNTCRSAMAHALLQHVGNEKFDVRSAGVYADVGRDASPYAKQALEEMGILVEHQATQLQEEDVQWADLILTMTRSHRRLIDSQYPRAIEKTFTFHEYINQDKEKDISDPFGGSLVIYKETLRELEQLINKLKER